MLVPLGDEVALADAVAALVDESGGARGGAGARPGPRARRSAGRRAPSGCGRSRATRPQGGGVRARADPRARAASRVGEPSRPATVERRGATRGLVDPGDGGLRGSVRCADQRRRSWRGHAWARGCRRGEVRARVAAAPLAELLTVDDGAGMLTLRGREELVARAERRRSPHGRAARTPSQGDRRAGEPAVRAHAGALGRHGAQERARRRRHRSVRGGDGGTGVHGLHDAVPGEPPHAPARHPLSRTTSSTRTTCASPITTISSRRTRRSRWCRSRASTPSTRSCAPTTRGCAGSTRPTLPRPPGAKLSSSPLQRLAEGLLRWSLGDELERLLSVGWRFHLGRRAASAPRPDLVLDPGILKLHLSDHRRRVLGKFADRLRPYRERWAEGAGPSQGRGVN